MATILKVLITEVLLFLIFFVLFNGAGAPTEKGKDGFYFGVMSGLLMIAIPITGIVALWKLL